MCIANLNLLDDSIVTYDEVSFHGQKDMSSFPPVENVVKKNFRRQIFTVSSAVPGPGA